MRDQFGIAAAVETRRRLVGHHQSRTPQERDRQQHALRLAGARYARVPRAEVSGTAARLLADVITARLAFLVSGGTGAGKTTLLSAALGAVAPHERIVCVEDAPELAPPHPHLVRLVARTANVEGVGEITVRQLVRQALRMRPDRIVVGEVRGAEVVDLLAALNTGHDGGAGTVRPHQFAMRCPQPERFPGHRVLLDRHCQTEVAGQREAEGEITLTFSNAPVTLIGWAVTDAQGFSTRIRLASLEKTSGLASSLFVLNDPRPKNPGRAKV